MTNAALYYHFKNKEDLFLAMLQRDHERTLTLLREAATSPGDLRSDLVQLATRYAVITRERRQSFQTLWRDMKQMAETRPHKLFGEMWCELMRPLDERLTQAQADGDLQPGDVRLYARLLHGMIMALTHGGQPDKPRKVLTQEIETVVDLFLHGLSRQEKGQSR